MKIVRKVVVILLAVLVIGTVVGCSCNSSCGTVSGKDACGTFTAKGLSSTSGCVCFYGKMGTQKFDGVEYSFTVSGSKVTFKLAKVVWVDSHYKKMTGTLSSDKNTIKMDELDIICKFSK